MIFHFLGPLGEENVDELLSNVRRRVGFIRTKVRHEVEESHLDQMPKWIADAEKIAKNVNTEGKTIDAESERVKKLVRFGFFVTLG